MHDHATHFLLLCPPHGYFQGIPSSHWSIDDVIVMSYCFLLRLLPLPDESSNQELSHLDTSLRMHYNHLERVFPTSFFIQLLEKTHLMLTAHQHTQHIAYLDLHVQGKCVLLACHINLTHIPTYHTSLGVHAHD